METNYGFHLQKKGTKIIFLFFLTSIFFISGLHSQSWYSLSSGTNTNVFSSTVYNGNLIVAGDFTIAGGVTVNHIAFWNGTNWAPLGSGTDSTVYTLFVYNGELIAGGKFTTAGGVSCNRIAKWNGSSWSPLLLGANAPVYSLSVYSGSLRVGGAFTNVAGVNANHIARWDGSAWYSMGLGTNDNVYCMTLFGADLILGGKFTTAGGLTCKRIADFNTNPIYLPLAAGIDSGSVLSLFTYNGLLMVGGDFTSIGGIPVLYIASWDGTNWNSVGSGMNSNVRSLGYFNGNLIAGGKFTNAGGTQANYIAGWNGTIWSTLGSGMNGGNSEVDALTTWANVLIGGGNFAFAGGNQALNVAAYGSIPVEPDLISPCGITTDSLTPLLNWTDVPNATSYGVEIATDNNFLNVILNASSIPISQYQVTEGTLSPNTNYFWHANAANGLGPGPWSQSCSFTTPNLIGINKNSGSVPKKFILYQNYPNPFNPSTTIKFDIPANLNNNANVSLSLYDLNGKKAAVLFEQEYRPGSYTVNVNAENLASGVYFCILKSGELIQTKKILLVK